MSVSFFTKTYENDYQKMLAGAFDRKWHALNYDFDVVGIALNNGVPEGVKELFIGKADVILDVPIMEQKVLDYFDLKEANVYALAELACIMFCETQYLVYVQGDSLCTNGDWIEEGISILEEDEQVILVSPGSEVNTRGDYDLYCSDQAFIARTSDLQKKEVYSYHTIDADYPSYGGLSFEHLVGNYMKATGKKRRILGSSWVIHPAY